MQTAVPMARIMRSIFSPGGTIGSRAGTNPHQCLICSKCLRDLELPPRELVQARFRTDHFLRLWLSSSRPPAHAEIWWCWTASRMADIPLTTGPPDRGRRLLQFHRLHDYDPLVLGNDVSDRPASWSPGRATEGR